MIGFIQRQLGHKIMLAIIISVSLVMAAEITVRLYFGTRDRIDIVTSLSQELAQSVYAGVKHPMSVGDDEAIRKGLADLREKKENLVVLICDFDQEIIYATHSERLGTNLHELLKGPETLEALSRALKTGIEPQRSFEEEADNRHYLVTIQPILNQEECHHCHGSSRRVLGSVVVRMDVDRTFQSVVAARNRSLLIGLVGISAIIGIMYLLMNRLVRRPLESLAEQAKRLAEGDMSVYVDIKRDDEIGILADAFNYMVRSIASFSRRLEKEVTRKTALLHERTNLVSLLEQSNRRLREMDKLKSAFLANMSHELRTPMNAIIGYTDLLLDGVDGPINEEQAKSLQKVAKNARHLLQLINDVLDISKIESGKIELSPRETDLRELIESVIPSFEPMIAQKGLKLNIEIDENLPPVYVDPDKVEHILMNLLSNAVKFTQKGSITVRAKPSKRGIKPGEDPIFAEVSVEDTGIGIKEEDLGNIFDKFVQADLSLVRQYEGTGLGLSIARALVGLHKGLMWATSKFGKGSTFIFTLPLKKEILERPAEPIIELSMAEGLARALDEPVETFLKEPRYAGMPVRCHEYLHCGQTSCPAYASKDRRCWLILGTQCAGMKVAAYPEKVESCKACEIIQKLVLEEGVEKTAEQIAKGKEARDGRPTILAIDDNEEAIDIIDKFLGKDYRVVGLLSGANAVEKAREIRPVAITLDIMMPDKDGWQVLRELKSHPETQGIPVVILSIVDRKKLGFSLGAADYLVKPVERRTLLQKIKNLEKRGHIQKILIVDHNEERGATCLALLEDEGYEAHWANNSKEAIQAIRKARPDLIILDLTMPQVSGFDIIEYVKTEKDAMAIPLIILATRDLTRDEIEELNGRIQGIIHKKKLDEEGFLQEIRETLKGSYEGGDSSNETRQ